MKNIRNTCARCQVPMQNNSISNSLNDATESQLGVSEAATIRNNLRNTRAKIHTVSDRTDQPNLANITTESNETGINEATAVQNNTGNTRVNVEVLNDGTNQNSSANLTTESGAKKKKRTRGPTFLPKVWALNKPINVSFNGLGLPNDTKRTSTLVHFLGTIARNGKYYPLNYKDWRLMPEDPYKNDMLNEVKSKFDLPPGSDGYVLKSINHKWRNWKCQLKNLNFDPDVPIEEQLLEVPERVNAEQYKEILDHCFTDKAQQVSEKNKESRAKLEILHRRGKKSYAVVSEIMKDHMGRYPTRAELFEKCCYPSDRLPMSEAVLEAIEKMKEVATQNDENSSDCDMVHDPDDAFGKIMVKDKDGRVRMYGMGVKPTDIYGSDALLRKSMEGKEEMRALRGRVEELTTLVHNTHNTLWWTI